MKITIEELSKKGKTYKWEKHHCDKCQRDMWGHGFVMRYFAEALDGVYLKRYRCPDCSTVVTTRPETHWNSIRSAILTIYRALKSKLTGLWPPGFPRQRGLHWLKRFIDLAKMENQNNLSWFLTFCFAKQLRFFT
ncbi:MAG: hypothetical protein HY537_11725 [Deltaproteobacteria bacterium]|nr:hypothetical protein [Deltaproteobacteria bacterium]